MYVRAGSLWSDRRHIVHDTVKRGEERMKYRLLFLICCFFLCAALPCTGEETESKENTASAQIQDDGKNDSASSSAEDGNVSPGSPEKKKKSLANVVGAVLKPLPEEDEVDSSTMGRFVNVMGNFFLGKYPLTIDFGAEPRERGSMVFTCLQYNWNERYASAILVKYESSSSSENSGDYEQGKTLVTRNTKRLCFQFDPFIRYFGDSSQNAKTPLFMVKVGLMNQWYDMDVSGTNVLEDIYYTSDLQQKLAILAPYVDMAFWLPFLNYFEFYAETHVAPVFGLLGKISYENALVSSGDDKPIIWEGTGDYKNINTPILQQDIGLTLFRYVRLSTRLTYWRLPLLHAAPDGEEYLDVRTSWRYGVEIILPSKTARRGSSHLWAGLYYNHDWSYITDSNELSHDGKIVLAFGT